MIIRCLGPNGKILISFTQTTAVLPLYVIELIFTVKAEPMFFCTSTLSVCTRRVAKSMAEASSVFEDGFFGSRISQLLVSVSFILGHHHSVLVIQIDRDVIM